LNRLEILKMGFVARACVALLAFLPLACSAAEQGEYQLGKQYKQVRQAQVPADPSRIQVVEVFAYSCPHCFQFEPHIEAWKKNKPADVDFMHLPHTLGAPAAVFRNKAMYASQMLGVFDRFHRALFGAIHGAGRTMATADEVRALFIESTGIKGEDYDGAYGSFAVDSRFRMGENAIREMGVASVPTMVVDGKYYTSPASAGGFKQVLQVTDFLIEQARKERQR
jgi:protein dithiol oxidoreductase (disulfide-forming)